MINNDCILKTRVILIIYSVLEHVIINKIVLHVLNESGRLDQTKVEKIEGAPWLA